jgi:hypothetical protein
MGVDVGIRRDSAAFVWGQWHGVAGEEVLHVGSEIMFPEDEGPAFGVADIRARLAGRYRAHDRGIREIGYDPWSFRESAEILADQGLPMVEFPQNAARMAPASEQLYELVTDRRLIHDGNPDLRAQVLAAVIAPTERGGWKISKRKSLERIDAAVALAIMADRAVTLLITKPPNRGVTIY